MSGDIRCRGRVLLAVLAIGAVVTACSAAASSPSVSATVQSPDATVDASGSAALPTYEAPSYEIWTANPTVTNSDTSAPDANPTPAPTAPGKPAATPPAPGQSWGGLVITAAPKRQAPPVFAQSITTWRGQTYGVVPGKVQNVVNLARRSVDGSWTTISTQIPGDQAGVIAGNATTLVVMQQWGAVHSCKTGTDGFEHCSYDAHKIWTSTDGITWTAAGTLPGSADTSTTFLAAGPGGFIAGASPVINGAWSPRMWTSADGATWKELSLPASFKGVCLDTAVVVPGGYVVTGGLKRIVPEPGFMGGDGGSVVAWWSADGSTWNQSSVQVPKGGAEMMNRVYQTDKGLLATGFLATGGDMGEAYISAAWTSLDHGHTWQYHATDTADPNVDRAAFVPQIPVSRWGLIATDGHRFISFSAPAQYGNLNGAWESFDGITWHKLKVQGLDYLVGAMGNAYMARMDVDDQGVVITFDPDATEAFARGWATP